MDAWSDKIGKKVKIIFDDGLRINVKIGIILSVSSSHLFIKNSDNEEEGLSLSRIIRIEVLDGE